MIFGIGNLIGTAVMNKTEGDKNRNKMDFAAQQEKHLSFLQQQELSVKSMRFKEQLAQRNNSHIDTMSGLKLIKNTMEEHRQTVQRNQEKLSSLQL